MKSCCIRCKCIQCCLETEMPLLNEDVERIKRLGFNHDHFVVNRDGWLQLRNHDGRCVFNNGEQCSIYENRPEGCRLYPIIFDKDKNCVSLDEGCPHRDEFKISELDFGIVSSLVKRLEAERRQRK